MNVRWRDLVARIWRFSRGPTLGVAAATVSAACESSPDAGLSGSPGAAEADLHETDAGLRFGAPDEEGVDAQSLIDLTSFIGNSQRRVFSFLVSKNGRVIYELYTSSLGRDHAHYVMSATKSFTSALVGVAVGQGLVANEETSVADALPAALFPNAAARDRFRRVTVREVLGMSALDAQVPPHRNLPEDVTRQAAFFASTNRAAFALGQELLPEPGVSFQYTDITPLIASGIVTYASGMTALDYANKTLFGPMGFKNQEWMHEDATGIDNGAYGLRVRPVDMQKFGLLFMSDGLWRNEQLVPADWVHKSFTPWIKSNPAVLAPNYGWYWWTFNYAPGWTARVADGWKGQRIAIIPEQRVVVTMTGNVTDGEEAYFEELVRNYVIPAVAGREGQPPRPDAALRGPLRDAVERVRTGPPRFEGVEDRMIPSIEPKQSHHPFHP